MQCITHLAQICKPRCMIKVTVPVCHFWHQVKVVQRHLTRSICLVQYHITLLILSVAIKITITIITIRQHPCHLCLLLRLPRQLHLQKDYYCQLQQVIMLTMRLTMKVIQYLLLGLYQRQRRRYRHEFVPRRKVRLMRFGKK